MRNANSAAIVPHMVTRDPSKCVFKIRHCHDSIRNRMIQEVVNMVLEDWFGCLREGSDHGGDRAKAERDERVVGFREFCKSVVGFFTELKQ